MHPDMKRKDIPTLIALLIAGAALTGVIAGYGRYSIYGFLVAFVMSIGQVKKVSGTFQLMTVLVVMACWGAAMDIIGQSFPLFTMACMAMAFTSGTRFIFAHSLGHLRMPWLEPVLFVLTAGAYVWANLHSNVGWMGWALPAAPLLFAGFATLGSVADATQMKRLTANGYGVKIGQPAPDFVLEDQDGNKVKLSDYRGKRHMLLIFVRGDWCPTCHIMLRSYQKDKQKFQEKNIMVVAIGPDPVGVNRDMVQRLDLDYILLSDDKQEVNRAYGVQLQPNNPTTKYSEGIPMPAAFLVDVNGAIRYISRHDQVGNYIDPRDIFPAVESLKPEREVKIA